MTEEDAVKALGFPLGALEWIACPVNPSFRIAPVNNNTYIVAFQGGLMHLFGYAIRHQGKTTTWAYQINGCDFPSAFIYGGPTKASKALMGRILEISRRLQATRVTE